VKEVARELGVRYVLEGGVRKAANRVRITGQLIDTSTGAHIWANRFDGRGRYGRAQTLERKHSAYATVARAVSLC
jgi:TolB-like protein